MDKELCVTITKIQAVSSNGFRNNSLNGDVFQRARRICIEEYECVLLMIAVWISPCTAEKETAQPRTWSQSGSLGLLSLEQGYRV